jgi:uncharacterized protein with beta-barrel porin domain
MSALAQFARADANQTPQNDSATSLRAWSTVYTGRSSLAGDAANGTEGVTASVVGTTFGADTQLTERMLLGGSLGFSRQTFSSNSGRGRSDDVLATLYARGSLWGRAYVSLAAGYGWHDINTRRAVVLFGSNVLEAKYRAEDWGGRIEGGYGFSAGAVATLSPFLAFVGDSYHQPNYSEIAVVGSSNTAVAYSANVFGVTHAEFGARYNQYFSLGERQSLSLDTVAAWEHEFDSSPLVLAAFQTAQGSRFQLRGTMPASETALLGVGLRLLDGGRFTFGLRSDGRFGAGTNILSGTADVTYRW